MTMSAHHALIPLPLPNSSLSCRFLPQYIGFSWAFWETDRTDEVAAFNTGPGIIAPCLGFPTTAGKMHRGASSPATPASNAQRTL